MYHGKPAEVVVHPLHLGNHTSNYQQTFHHALSVRVTAGYSSLLALPQDACYWYMFKSITTMAELQQIIAGKQTRKHIIEVWTKKVDWRGRPPRGRPYNQQDWHALESHAPLHICCPVHCSTLGNACQHGIHTAANPRPIRSHQDCTGSSIT